MKAVPVDQTVLKLTVIVGKVTVTVVNFNIYHILWKTFNNQILPSLKQWVK